MKIQLIKTAIATVLSASLLTVSPLSSAKDIAGKTIIAKGKVRALETSTEQTRRLKRRSPIYDVDKVKTEANSKTQLRMTDGGMIALKENSELLISNYEFNAADQSGSVVMELVKGGLRSVTGAIKSDKGNYQLKTPVGSIGIRGTHYEIEIIQGEVFIAVWDGAVDVNVEVSGNEQEVGLGEGEDYSYAKIDENGEVTELLEPPENFNEGHSSSTEEEEEDDSATAGADEEDGEGQGDDGQEEGDSEGEGDGQEEEDSEDEGDGEGEGDDEDEDEGEGDGDGDGESEGEGDDEGEGEGDGESEGQSDGGEDQSDGGEDTAGGDGGDDGTDGEDEVVIETGEDDDVVIDNSGDEEDVVVVEEDIEDDTEFISEDEVEEELALTPEQEIADLVAQRTGVFTYSNVSNLTFETGSGSNFQASMTIDFDTAEVTTGNLSFEDGSGEWFAAFNGFINGHEIELGVNFASHGNNLATGTIDSTFIDGIDGLLNSFELFEIDNTNIRVKGRFDLK